MTTLNPTHEEVPFYRKAVLATTGLVLAFGVATLAPVLDDREKITHREIAAGVIVPVEGAEERIDDATDIATLQPGSPEFIQAMQRDPVGAITTLYDADPENSLDLLLEAVNILGNSGRYAQAVQLLDRAARDHPNAPIIAATRESLAQAQLAGVLANNGGEAGAARGGSGSVQIPEGADPNMVQQMTTDPQAAVMTMYEESGDPAVLLNAAQIYASRGKRQDALEMLDYVDERHPNLAESATLRQRIMAAGDGAFDIDTGMGMASGGGAAGMASAPLAQETAPETTTDAHGRNSEEMLTAIRATLKDTPQNYDLAFETGTIYMSSRKFDLAEEFYRHALNARPGDANAKVMLATAVAAQGRAQEAELLLLDVIEHHPTHGLAVSNLAYLYERMNQPEKAIEYYELVLKTEVEAPADVKADARRSLQNLQAP